MNAAALIEEVETLREENRQLRALLAVDPAEEFAVAAKAKLGLTRSRARLLYVLLFSARTTREAVYHAYCDFDKVHLDPKIIDVHIFYLRKALEPHGITIENIWGQGFSVSPENRAKVLSLLGLEQT